MPRARHCAAPGAPGDRAEARDTGTGVRGIRAACESSDVTEVDEEVRARTLLAQLGAALVAAGQPVNEVEDDLVEAGQALGFPDVQIAAAPTGITLSLAPGSPATFVGRPGSLRLHQAADVREIRHHLVRGRLSPADALDRLAALRAQPRGHVGWAVGLGWVLCATRIALILQPTWPSVAIATIGGIAVVALVRATGSMPRFEALLPVAAAFVVACLVFAAARGGLVEAPLRTLLAPLAVLFPGALIVTAMAELVSGHMVAGTSRLGYGLVQMLLFTLGIVGASRVVPLTPDQLGNIRIDHIGWYAAPAGLLLVTIAVGLLESPKPRLLPWILVVLAITFGAQVAGQRLGGAFGGAFFGALAATVGSYAVEAIVPRLARLVVFLPSFWLLVPGSLGVLTATQVAVDPGRSADVLGVVGIVTAIALGLLLGTAIAQAVQGLRSRGR